jgi:hypothetical protein
MKIDPLLNVKIRHYYIHIAHSLKLLAIHLILLNPQSGHQIPQFKSLRLLCLEQTYTVGVQKLEIGVSVHELLQKMIENMWPLVLQNNIR